jgi:phage terminase large subunit GpA-like protein
MTPPKSLRPEVEAKFASSSAVLADLLQSAIEILIPPEEVDPVDWIANNVTIPSTVNESEGVPLELYGTQRGLVRLAVKPSTKKMGVPKGVRTGITQTMTGLAAYFVGHRKLPIGLWQPTEDDAKTYFNDYWHPTVHESPTMRKLVRRPVKGDSQDRWNWMQLVTGGKMQIKFASSDDQFRRDTLAVVMGDEVDGDAWRVGKKGSQGAKFALMYARTVTFDDRKQIVWSSPLDEATSNIWKFWLESDQRHFYVKCPQCDEVWYFKWGGKDTDYGFKWSTDDNGYVDHCWYQGECGCVIEEECLPAMDAEAGDAVYPEDNIWSQDDRIVKRLGWQPTKLPREPGNVGCHLPAYISLFPGASWKSLAQEWLDAQGDPEKLQTFVNNKLGEPWRTLEINKQIVVGDFAHRRPVPFEYEVPSWVVYLTAYVDVQEGWADADLKLHPRYEVQVVGWGPGYEAALVGHFVLQDYDLFSPAAVQQLDDVVFRKWRRKDGRELQIVIAGIDASHRQNEVMALCRAPHRLKVYRPMKGESEVSKDKAPIIVNAPKPSDTRNVLIRVGTRRAKDVADRLLRNETPGPHHLHIPSSIGLALDTDDDGRAPFFDQLFAEKKVLDRGVEKWVRQKSGAKDTGEAWDCLVGNVAALELAMLTYRPVGREVGDLSPKPPRTRYEGEDQSVMARVLEGRMLKGFQGDATRSILPPTGRVNLPASIREHQPNRPTEDASSSGDYVPKVNQPRIRRLTARHSYL